MSKTSNKSRYTQLVMWLPNAFKTRAKRKQAYNNKQSLQPRRIKNG